MPLGHVGNNVRIKFGVGCICGLETKPDVCTSVFKKKEKKSRVGGTTPNKQ
jgi:hypothetical protein